MTQINYDVLTRGVDPYADAAAAAAILAALGKVYLGFNIGATELAAGTSFELTSPVAGKITKVSTMIQTAIVTGGVITAQIGTTDITGISITVADSATKGTIQSDTPTGGDGTDVVAVGSRIQIVPSAAFNGGGNVSGYVEITL